MRKIKIVTVLFVIFIFSFSEMVFSQGWGRGMGRGQYLWGAGYLNPNNPYMNVNYPNLLNLTQDQLIKINTIQTKFLNESLDILNNLNQKNLELQNLMMVQPIDQTVVNEKIDEINKVQAEMQKKLIAQKSEVEKILTEEQKALINSNSLGYGSLPMPYGAGAGYGTGRGFYRGAGIGSGPYYNYGLNLLGRTGIGRMGRGPCGLGLGRGVGWNQWW